MLRMQPYDEDDEFFFLLFHFNGARRKTCPNATLSTTWADPGSNPGLRVERLATDRLSHGTAFVVVSNNEFIIFPTIFQTKIPVNTM